MLSWFLALGLLVSGGLGFALGAKPAFVKKTSDQHASDRNQLLMDFLYPLAIAFFAGFVFSTLVPEALTHSKGTVVAFVTGIVVMAGLSKLVFKRDPCCEAGHDHRGFGAMSLIAMSVCSLNDGMLIGLLNPVWYSGLNLGMLVHKVSSSFAIAQVLTRTNYKGNGLILFGIIYTLISPLALFLVNTTLIKTLPNTEWILAFSAGLLTYVTLTSLVPHARDIVKRQPRALFGIAVAFLISVTLGFWHTALHKKMDVDGAHGDIKVDVDAGTPAALPKTGPAQGANP